MLSATHTLDYILPLQIAAYDESILSKDFKLLGNLVSPTKNFGFVAQGPSNDIIVAFRGTQLDDEWVDDFEAKLIKSRVLYFPCQVHEGFQQIMKTLSFPEIPRGELTIIGHSLGGALANLLAVKLFPRHPTLYTFGCPRVGDSAFATCLDVLVPVHYRITNRFDIVPHLPGSFQRYRHAGIRIKVNGTGHTLKARHSLKSYGEGLKRLIPQQ